MAQQNRDTFVMTRLPWIVAALSVVALVATLFMTRTREPVPETAGVSDHELLARLEALEDRSPRSSGMRTPAGMQTGQSVVPANGSALGDDAMGPQKSPEQMEADRKRELQMLEASFARDKADPVRGGQVERTLEQTVTSETMAGTGLKPADVAIDCRATTCRVVGQFAKRGDAEDWALFYVTSAGGNVVSQIRMAYVTLADGSTEVRIFATRAKR